MNTIIPNSKPYFWLIALIGIVQSCTKTEYTDYETEPQNHIVEYRVTNAQQELLGAIDNENNTITVYIPYYLGIEYLNVEVKMDEGATLLDSAGNEINLDGGLEPVRINPDSTEYNYTVAAASGEQRIYRLIQKILPHGDSLHATYALLEEGQTVLARAANSPLIITGNFESSSANARFLLTDKATGQVYDNFIEKVSMIPGDNGYTFNTFVSPEALAGDYTVRVEHQGRSADLPDLHIYYQKYPLATAYFNSTAAYAPGDTLTLSVAINPPEYNRPSILLPVERLYIKVKKEGTLVRNGVTVAPRPNGFVAPEGFPESLYDTEIPLEIVSQTRREIKAIFPDMPAGYYTRNNTVANADLALPTYSDANFGFYLAFKEEAGWGTEGYVTCSVGPIRFTVNEKE